VDGLATSCPYRSKDLRSAPLRRGVLFLFVVLLLSVALPAQADDLATAINGARGQTLPVDGNVDGFAQRAADRISAGQSLVHSDLSPLLSSCNAAGEVIGYGPDLASVMSAFASSPSHWNTINQSKWNAMGTGQVRDSNGRLWVAVVFCTLLQAPAVPPPTTTPPPPAATAPPPTTTTPPMPAEPSPTVIVEPPADTDLGPTVRSAQRKQLIFRKIGPILNLEGTASLVLGAGPFLDEEDWRQFRLPSVS